MAQCPTCRTVGPLILESRDYCESKSAWIDRAFATIEAVNVVPAEALAEAVEAPKKTRCPHYSVIVEFFAVARELGFETGKESKAAWRAAIGMLLGRRIATRANLSAQEWAFCTNALRMGRLFI
jgi:hypothetical protein